LSFHFDILRIIMFDCYLNPRQDYTVLTPLAVVPSSPLPIHDPHPVTPPSPVPLPTVQTSPCAWLKFRAFYSVNSALICCQPRRLSWAVSATTARVFYAHLFSWFIFLFFSDCLGFSWIVYL
jgi:hypothetical protein